MLTSPFSSMAITETHPIPSLLVMLYAALIAFPAQEVTQALLG